MKTVSTNFQNKLDTRCATEPILIVKIDWPTGVKYYSGKSFTFKNETVSNTLIDISNITDEAKVNQTGNVRTLSITLEDTDGHIKTLVKQRVPYGTTATIYQNFDGLEDDDANIVMAGVLGGDVTWSEGTRGFNFEITNIVRDDEIVYSPSYEDLEEAGIAVPIANPEDNNWPFVFGSPEKVKAIPVQSILRTRISAIGYYDIHDSDSIVYKLENTSIFKTGNYLRADVGAIGAESDLFGWIANDYFSPQNSVWNGAASNVEITSFPDTNDFRKMNISINSASFDYTNYYVSLSYLDNRPPLFLYEITAHSGYQITLNMTPVWGASGLTLAEDNWRDFSAWRSDFCPSDPQVYITRIYEYPPVLTGLYYMPTISGTVGAISSYEDPVLGTCYKFTWDISAISSLSIPSTDANKFPIITETKDNWWLTQTNTSADKYVISMFEHDNGLVGDLMGEFRNDEGKLEEKPIPTDRYTVTTENLISGVTNKQTVINFTRSIKDYSPDDGGEWTGNLYCKLTPATSLQDIGDTQSAVNTYNAAEVITWMFKNYSNIRVVEDDDYDDVVSKVEGFPLNFVLSSNYQVSQICESLAWQSRIAIFYDSNQAYLKFMGDIPDSVYTFDETNVGLKSTIWGFTKDTDLITRSTVIYSNDRNRQSVYENNLDLYGTKEASWDYFAYYGNKNNALAEWWLHRLSNIWRTVVFKSFLNAYRVETFDTVTINIPEYSANAIKGTVLRRDYNPKDDSITFYVQLGSRAGAIGSNGDPLQDNTYWLGPPISLFKRYVYTDKKDLDLEPFRTKELFILTSVAGVG